MLGQKLNDNVFSSLLQTENCYFLLGMLENKPVCTALLFCSNHQAGIYLIATSADARKKGFGTEITLYCLERAKALNCTSIFLQATDAGYNLYKKMGFENNGDITIYRLKNKIGQTKHLSF